VQDTAFKAFFDYDQFRVQTSSANDTMGSAIANLGTDFYCNYLYTTTFVATPATGYHFVQWSNGLTTDTARIVIVQDTVMVAYFAPNKYTVTAKSASATMGTTSGSGVYDYGTSKVVGRQQEHIKLELVDSKSSNVMNGIAFGQSQSARFIKSKRSFDICYTIEENIYKRGEVQLQIEDIQPTEG
jgi:hypothetical protein